MANEPRRVGEPDLAVLVGGIIRDAETLIGQEFEILRSELRREFHQAEGALISMGGGVALVATGGVMTALMAVHALHRGSRLPLWACYGLVGGLLGGVGAGLVSSGRKQVANVSLVPTQTVEALKENLEWLKDQANPKET